MGKAKALIDELIEKKANGNNFQMYNIKMKLMLKGINLDSITEDSVDPPEVITMIYQVAKDFNVVLSKK